MKTESVPGVKGPKGWVFRKKVSERHTIYAVETPPGMYPFAFRDTNGTDGWDTEEDEDSDYRTEVHHLQVRFPRLLWVVSILNKSFHNARVFWIDKPFKETKMATELYLPPLPNVDDAGLMCVGNFRCSLRVDAEIVNEFMEHAFNSVWTSDIDCFYNALDSQDVVNVKEWAERDRKRKNAFWDVEMAEGVGKNFRQLIDGMI